jgi:hypothetical protein
MVGAAGDVFLMFFSLIRFCFLLTDANVEKIIS